MGRVKKISAGHYLYKGYIITKVGYYPPEQRVVWEAVNPDTGCGDYHGFSLREVKFWIDEDYGNN